MGVVAVTYRVRLLGEFALADENGVSLKAPTDGVVFRPLIALAIRPGQARPARELSGLAWPEVDEAYRPELSVPIARIRKAGVPVSHKSSTDGTYRALLERTDVDLTHFVDCVNDAGGSLTVGDVDELLGLWLQDPEPIYSFLRAAEFDALRRARATLISQLSEWSQAELSTLRNLERFRALFEEECASIPVGGPVAVKRVLVVDDNKGLTDMLTDLLGGYSTMVANTVGEAMAIITDPGARIDGALVDLHLSDRLDSQGISVLDALRNKRPDVPRVLMTSSPPEEGMTEFATRYGLFELLVKNQADAPVKARDIVDRMLSDRPEDAIRRARATLQTLAGRVQQRAVQGVVAARHRSRNGDATGESLEQAADRLDAVESATEAALNAVGTATNPAEAESVVDNFAATFGDYLDVDETVR
jgi:CheY-like chemotaxis protein